jgi:predicted PurR-regulated permease PerM
VAAVDADKHVPKQEQDPLASGATINSPEPERVLLHMPVNVRSLSLAVIAVIASLFALKLSQEVLVPILFGLMASYALAPVVDQLERWRIPRFAGAGVIVTAVAVTIGWGTWSLSDQVGALVDTLPAVTQKLRQLTEATPGSTISKVQAAATEIESVGDDKSAAASARSGPKQAAVTGATTARERAPQVVVEKPRLDVRSYVLSGTLGVLAFLGQVAVMLFVALFLLASGNTFRRKMVKLAGPSLSQKKVTIETLNEINDQIQRYLLVQVAVSILVGIATWLAFYLLGLNQSAVWGVVAAVTNLIPYVGAILVGGGSALVALVQFDSVEMALAVGGTSVLIHTLIGNLLTPWWMGRASQISAFAVFVCVLAFGWLWGISGLLLGVPILMVVKSICDRVDDLKPIGELLSA